MAAFMNVSYETPGEQRPLEAVGAAFARAFVDAGRDAPVAPRPREAVGAAFVRAFAEVACSPKFTAEQDTSSISHRIES